MTANILRKAGYVVKLVSATTIAFTIVVVDANPVRAPHRQELAACGEIAPMELGALVLSQQDVVDIKKVATTEVVATLKGRAFENQVRGVVDTIMNRTRSGHWGSLKHVVNAKNQFSKITGPRSLSPYGNVDNMPERAISSKVAAEVDRWLETRARGIPSSVGENLNYLNPLFSSQSSLRSWGWSVVAQAKASGYVMGAGKATHYHGTSRDLVKYKPGAFRVLIIH
jgi:hypothetical protein